MDSGMEGVGMAAEQVLYSWMSIATAPGHGMIHALPCGWNLQVGSWHALVSWADANAPRRQCAECHALHGAGAEGKAILAVLGGNLETARGCARAFEAVRGRRHYARGSASEALLLRVAHACCGNRTR